RNLVVVIVNCERRRQTEPGGVASQDPGAEAVEGPDDDVGGSRGEAGSARPHFRRGLVCEGDSENRCRIHTLLGYEPGDLANYYARFARAGPRQNEQWGAAVDYSFPLDGIEAVEELVEVPHPGGQVRRRPARMWACR